MSKNDGTGHGAANVPVQPKAMPRAADTASASQARLKYVSDELPGIRRVRRGRGFAYYAPDGKLIEDDATRCRIAALAVPPAWEAVWICPDPHGHLQASGRDDRGRKQYRYHTRWRCVRDAEKFAHLGTFGKALPRLRRRISADLGQQGLPRDKVVAIVVRLLDQAYLRVGDEAYARANRSFGATTLRNSHARVVNNQEVHLRFRAKSGRLRDVQISNPRLARLVRRCRELPGQRLFEYVDDNGEIRALDSTDVNEYLAEVSGEPVTSKEFRTWAGSLMALRALLAAPAPDSATAANRQVRAAIDAAAEALGNTAAVCRRSYVHPVVIERYLRDPVSFVQEAPAVEADNRRGLRSGETYLLHLIETGADS